MTIKSVPKQMVRSFSKISPLTSISTFLPIRSHFSSPKIPKFQTFSPFKPNLIQYRNYSEKILDKTSLTEDQRKLVDKELESLKQFKELMKKMEVSDDDLQMLERSIHQLEDLFLLVVVGEFNSGKSTFLNALMGQRFLQEGVTPTTSKIGLLKFGKNFDHRSIDSEVDILQLPVDWLKDITLVDTPGINAVIRSHEQITEHFVPRSDLVLFVTSADRPFTETERLFLERIRQWGKKIVIIISKADLVETNEELSQILEFVRSNFSKLTGTQPEIFPVSSRKALRAKLNANDEIPLAKSPLWSESRFSPLEEYILKTLDSRQRARLKLENPLGVADHLSMKYSQSLTTRKKMLDGDLKSLEMIREQIKQFSEEMKIDFQLQHERIDNTLLKMSQRGVTFLDNKISLTNLLDLARSSKLRKDFETEVVGETSLVIERQMGDIVDWLLSKNSRLWNDVMQFARTSTSQMSQQKMVGSINTNFEYNRQELINGISHEALKVVQSYSPEVESQKLVEQIRSALVATAVVEGGIGLGALLTMSVLDITGIVGVSVLAALGLGILPYRRAQLKASFETKVSEVRSTLKQTVASHFERELGITINKIENAVDPYARFVKVEERVVEDISTRLSVVKSQLEEVRNLISDLFPTK